MLEKNNNASDNFKLYEDEESITKEQDIERDYKDLVSKNSDTRSCVRDNLSRHTP